MTNLFHHLFACDRQRIALQDSTTAWSYGDLDLHARRLAGALRARGVQPGDRIVAQTDKSVDSFALWLACLSSGVIYVPTNTAYTPDEISYFCTDAGSSLLVVDDPTRLAAVATATVSIAELIAEAANASPAQVIDRDLAAPAALVYTSGTTGRPKGATLTHGCLLDNARALVEVWQMSEADVLAHTLPIFHVHGLFIALHPMMLVGAQVRFLPRFEPSSAMQAMAGATVFMGVPTYYTRLLATEGFGPDVCATMRLFTSGSAPMTELTHTEFTERTGHPVVERYGMSEAGIITSNRLDSVVPGSVGHALPGYEVRVVAPDGEPLGPDTAGVVEVRGPSLCAGYWNRPDADATSRRPGGWFSTGDIGTLDPSGRLTLEGRSSDMIISGGLNIYPKEIEMVLDEVPGIVESAVVGRPDPDFGEAVTAVLVLEPGVEIDNLPLAEALARLARFKHPKSIEVVDELPRNAMGKVLKSLLRG